MDNSTHKNHGAIPLFSETAPLQIATTSGKKPQSLLKLGYYKLCNVY
jgi:hypothetical protein